MEVQYELFSVILAYT